ALVPTSTLLPYTTLFRSKPAPSGTVVNLMPLVSIVQSARESDRDPAEVMPTFLPSSSLASCTLDLVGTMRCQPRFPELPLRTILDRKSTRLNSSHVKISY